MRLFWYKTLLVYFSQNVTGILKQPNLWYLSSMMADVCIFLHKSRPLQEYVLMFVFYPIYVIWCVYVQVKGEVCESYFATSLYSLPVLVAAVRVLIQTWLISCVHYTTMTCVCAVSQVNNALPFVFIDEMDYYDVPFIRFWVHIFLHSIWVRNEKLSIH